MKLILQFLCNLFWKWGSVTIQSKARYYFLTYHVTKGFTVNAKYRLTKSGTRLAYE